MNFVPIRRALISVSDKTGVVEFARALRARNIAIISTGGTLAALRNDGVDALAVADLTGFPEILDGRVKTLHPRIHAGILAVTENEQHQRQLREHGIEPIDMVVVNLYPFEQTIGRGNITLEEAIGQIDIGGPSMVRAAAKNYRDKTVIVDPAQYAVILDEMARHDGAVSEETRFALAQAAFRHTAQYDSVIAGYLSAVRRSGAGTGSLPSVFSAVYPKAQDLRYGENPHQQAALYGGFNEFFGMIHGKELSYNNIVDIQAAAELSEEFPQPTAVIVKHTNPCGAGSAPVLAEAYRNAFHTDEKSAFGGIVCVNRPLDMDTAREIDRIFTEVIIAPGFADGVLDLLCRKKDRRLILQRKPAGAASTLRIRSITGGILVQTADTEIADRNALTVVTKRKPTEEEYAALLFAWRVAKHVKSNAIVYARADRTIGIGAGQMSRVDSARIAAMKARNAGLDLNGTVVASDAFFPFADGLLEAVNAGATAVIQPGGSIRDPEVIRTADEHNLAMTFTGIRHFRH